MADSFDFSKLPRPRGGAGSAEGGPPAEGGREMLVIHRHIFAGGALIEALLPGASRQYERARLTVEDDAVTIDLIGPKEVSAAPSLASNETAKSNVVDQAEPKGGILSRRASMRCGERSFQTFVGAEDEDTARAIILHRCGVSSRRLLDHDEKAAAAWRKIEDQFKLWMDGYDVTF